MSDQPPELPPASAEDLAGLFKPRTNVIPFATPESVPAKRPRGRPPKIPDRITVPGLDPDVAEPAEKALAKAVQILAAENELPEGQDQPAAKAPVTGRTSNGVNWAGIFLLYSKGVSLEELSDQFGVPRGKLISKARAEEWDLLVKHHGSAAVVAPPPLPCVVTQSAAEVDKAKVRIEANREEAFSVAKQLRGHVVKVLEAYGAESAFLRPEDILTMAKAAKMIDDAAMVALGDAPVSAAAAGAARATGNGNALPQIVINIPQFVSPQALREAEKQVSEIPAPQDVEVRQLQELEVVGGKISNAVAPMEKGKRFTIDFAKLGAAVGEEGEDE